VLNEPPYLHSSSSWLADQAARINLPSLSFRALGHLADLPVVERGAYFNRWPSSDEEAIKQVNSGRWLLRMGLRVNTVEEWMQVQSFVYEAK